MTVVAAAGVVEGAAVVLDVLLVVETAGAAEVVVLAPKRLS